MTAGELDPSEVFRKTELRWRARRTLRRCRELMGDYPVLLPIHLRCTPEGPERTITKRTQLVIEGYPRCGNTFATFALKAAHNDSIVISSHVHTPAQVKHAVRLGVPTLVVVREPVDTVASLVIAAPHVRLKRALREYIHHHREILPYRYGYVVGTFDRVTTDLNSVIDALNARFSTAFKHFAQSPEGVDAVFRAIDVHHAKVHSNKIAERVAPRPSIARKVEKEWLLGELQRPELAALVHEARATYLEFDTPSPNALVVPSVRRDQSQGSV